MERNTRVYAPVDPVTVEAIAYLLQSYEGEGVSKEKLQELGTLLVDLQSGAVKLPELQSCFHEVFSNVTCEDCRSNT